MLDLKPRLAGAALLAGSVGTTLWHRSVFEAARGGPAGCAEWGLGLLTSLFASLGIVLLIHGSATFAAARRKRRSKVVASDAAAPGRAGDAWPPPCQPLDSRYEVAVGLAQRAIAASRGAGQRRRTWGDR